ncbi:hypothetical protein ANAPC5_01335 [Anaplasma phagocytophilum]|nr:hypothetical protein ANAPC5_01335 [Anaplasma phagocytophilum]
MVPLPSPIDSFSPTDLCHFFGEYSIVVYCALLTFAVLLLRGKVAGIVAKMLTQQGRDTL